MTDIFHFLIFPFFLCARQRVQSSFCTENSMRRPNKKEKGGERVKASTERGRQCIVFSPRYEVEREMTFASSNVLDFDVSSVDPCDTL